MASCRRKWCGPRRCLVLNRFVNFWFRPADPNQYAAIRMGYAFTSFLHLLCLWPIRFECFSKGGMISGLDAVPPIPSLFAHSPSEPVVTAAFLFMAVAMVCLFLGVLPRLSAILVAYWHYSLAFDLAPASSGYDVILRLVGYVVAVSPLGSPVWKLGRGISEDVPAYGLHIIRWQLFLIYMSTVWLKLGDSYWRNGQVLSYFMMSIYSNFHTPWFASAEPLSVVFTYGSLASEMVIPFFLFSPRLRFWGVVVGVLLHGGIAVTSTVWIFSFTMLMMYPAFVTAEDVRRWFYLARKLSSNLIPSVDNGV